MITWNHRIRALRRSGLTLAQIGDRVGLTAAAVCDIEQKRTKAPRGDAALALDALFRSRITDNPAGAPNDETDRLDPRAP